MSNHQTLKDLHSAISSQESEDGAEPYNSQDGVQVDLFGQEALPANHLVQQEAEKEKTTSDTYGLSSLISSESANLQRSLENRLRQLSDSDGSMIYKTTLKQKATPQGRSFFQLAASARTTKETDSFLPPNAWPTPRVADTNNLNNSPSVVQARVTKGRATVAEIASHNVSAWPTPTAAIGGASKNPNNKLGINGGNPMATAASLVPWLTPTTSDTNGVRKLDGKRSGGLNTQVVSAWPTPTHHNSKEGGYPGELTRNTIPLGAMKHMVAWATPNTMDHMAQRSDEALSRAKTKGGCSNLKDQIPISGTTHKSSIAETENIAPSQLNPRFSLWLMGYPIEWAYSGEAVTPLSRKRQRKS